MSKSVFSLERKMVSLKREIFYLVDRKSRKVLHTVQGQNTSVTIPLDILPKTKDNITIHNHPRYLYESGEAGGWGFSSDDLDVAVANNVFQSRVVGWDYYKDSPCVYVITRNGSNWKVDLSSASVILAYITNNLSKTLGTDYDRISATFLVYHKWIDSLSEKYGFYYDVLHF